MQNTNVLIVIIHACLFAVLAHGTDVEHDEIICIGRECRLNAPLSLGVLLNHRAHRSDRLFTRAQFMNSQFKSVENANADRTLVKVVLIHRHGDRNPITVGPKDPNKDWPDGLGQLTNAGKQRMYRVGKYVRQRYREFLSNNPLECYIRSADTDRCVASAELLSSALYEPSGRYVWNDNLKWQPVPVHSVPSTIDSMLDTSEACPRIPAELKIMQTTDRVKNLMARMDKIINYVQRDLGIKVESFKQLSWIYNDLKCEYEQNKIVPAWYDANIRTMLHDAAAEVFDIYTSTDLLKKLFSGPLLADIAYRFSNNDMVNDENVKANKIFQYSTHDTEVAATLNTLSVWDHKMPPYGATIFFELHNVNGRKIVKLFYLPSVDVTIQEIQLPCGQAKDQPCTLDQFVALVKKFQLPDWNGTCFQTNEIQRHQSENNNQAREWLKRIL